MRGETRGSPDDEIGIVVGDGDHDVGHVVGRVQVALHGGPEQRGKQIKSCSVICKSKKQEGAIFIHPACSPLRTKPGAEFSVSRSSDATQHFLRG